MVTKTCRWVNADGTYCNRPTKYTLAVAEDGSRHREYETWCADHKARAEAQVLKALEEEDSYED